jgi:hypothetical protein
MPDDDAHVDERRQHDSSSSDAPETPAIEAPDLPSIHAAAMPEIETAAPETKAHDSEVEQPELDTPVTASEPIALTAPAIPSLDAIEAAARRIEGGERREPTFAAPAAPPIEAPEHTPRLAEAGEAHDVEAGPVQEREFDAPAAESERIELAAPAIPSIEELEAVTSRIEGRERKEPTFDESVPEQPAAEDVTAASAAPAPLAADQPDKAARAVTRRIELPGIETRIEKRRIDSLRADPQMAGRRPIFPHIDPDEWPPERLGERLGEEDVPPLVAARANRQARAGTGWAISLGTILLIAGITAPAAIWQGQQQAPGDQDQLVMLPMPTSPSTPETRPAPQATLPEAPQPETSPPPAIAAEAPSAPPPAPPAPEVAQPSPQEQTTLSAVQSGGELNDAPVLTPPAPVLDLASKPKVQFPQAPSDVATGEVPFPPAARPFVPEQGTTAAAQLFLRAPAGASGPVNSTAMPAGTQAGTQTASIALKPNLMGQLKPKATSAQAARPAANTPQRIVRKPKPFFQQPPDQMFQTLIDTLSAGQPVNPATKPIPPSTRK